MALATTTGRKTGAYINDAYGQKTATAGTEITRVVPPRAGARAHIGGLQYKTGATDHKLAIFTTIDQVLVASDALADQAVVKLATWPTEIEGEQVLAVDHWLIMQYADGTWEAHKIVSNSGLSITLTTNLSQKINRATTAFYMGDEPAERIYDLDANTTTTLRGGDNRLVLGSGSRLSTPMLIVVNNPTDAGKLKWLSYFYTSE